MNARETEWYAKAQNYGDCYTQADVWLSMEKIIGLNWNCIALKLSLILLIFQKIFLVLIFLDEK